MLRFAATMPAMTAGGTMETAILIALVVLLLCTAAGLIFLAVTVSDNAAAAEPLPEGEAQAAGGGAGFRAASGGGFASTAYPAPAKRGKTFSYSKKSDITLMGKKTHIVNDALKTDFENTLAAMNKAAEPPEIIEPLYEETADTDTDETEFIDVLDLIGEAQADEPGSDTDEQNAEPTSGETESDNAQDTTTVNANRRFTDEEFLMSEELLR